MIELKSVNLKFEQKVIFKDFNYTFNDNVIYAIMGKSGCGKSTLLRIISGLLKPDSGKVMLDGKEVNKIKSGIFMMHQNYANFPWKTCLGNVLFPISFNQKVRPQYIKKANKLIKRVGLEGCEQMYPYELSGGMNQRLSLARVLMMKSSVILMDEPLSALDEVMRGKMQDLIMEVHKAWRNTIIIVTHDEQEALKMSDELIRF